MDNKSPKVIDLQQVEALPTTDLSPTDLALIKDYEDRGLPDLVRVTDEMVSRMMSLYLEGRPYSDIARIMRMDKVMVMFLSKKFAWFPVRRDYLYELSAGLKDRLAEAELTSQEILMKLQHALRKKMNKKIDRYLSTGDDTHVDEIDLKDVDKLLKTIAALEKKMTILKPKNSTPAVSPVALNLGEGMTIEQTSPEQFTITPKEKAVVDVVKQLADFRREEDRKKQEEISITKEKRNKGETNET